MVLSWYFQNCEAVHGYPKPSYISDISSEKREMTKSEMVVFVETYMYIHWNSVFIAKAKSTFSSVEASHDASYFFLEFDNTILGLP